MKGEYISIETLKIYQEIEKENKELHEKVDKAIEYIIHELYEHILNNDEETWNDEFYTDGKLNYKKLLIELLKDLESILNGDSNE